jgi:UDP:flavonoid glycosyltransferase YjiC (YdhE family)
MVPLARALSGAGHDVAFATAERFCRRVVEPAGFTAFAAGLSPLVVEERTMAIPEAAALGAEDVWRFGAQMFARVAAPAKVPDLVAVHASWAPDLVVHDAIDFAAPVAAARAGIVWASHSFGALQPPQFWELSAELMEAIWREWGVVPGPLGGMFRHLYLDICPPSFQADHAARIGVTRRMRPVPFDTPGGETLPAWVADLPEQPTVYVTMGTIFNSTPGVFEAAIAALGGEPCNVVMTVGHDRDPDELGPVPPNVHVERWIPQSLLFARCDAVVAHGGSGTVFAALSHGLPLVVLPQGANQFWNAERLVELGAAIRLGAEIEPSSLRAAVLAVLGQPSFRASAERLRREIDRMPPPAELVPALEDLAAGRPAGAGG